MGTSLRENEFRVPLHPKWLINNAKNLPELQHYVFEYGYGERFRVSDDALKEAGVTLATKGELYNEMTTTIIAKPMLEDFWNLRYGGTMICWGHFVLYGRLASTAVERQQTVFTFEGLNPREIDGRKVNAFPDNSRGAGIGGLHHLMNQEGIHPGFGEKLSLTVIGYGVAGKAIAEEATKLGFGVTVLSQRPQDAIDGLIPDVRYFQYAPVKDRSACNILVDGQSISMASFLASEDLIFNRAGQDAEAPVNYMTIDELETLDHDCSIVDISCDPAMGFPFSRTTTFHTPSYMVERMRVYSVDHIPGYFYDAGTWVYTRGLKPWLMDIKLGKSHWLESEIINPAIEILDGNIRNAKIIEYQQRETDHPHYCKDPQAWRLTVDANRVAIRKSLDGPVEI